MDIPHLDAADDLFSCIFLTCLKFHFYFCPWIFFFSFSHLNQVLTLIMLKNDHLQPSLPPLGSYNWPGCNRTQEFTGLLAFCALKTKYSAFQKIFSSHTTSEQKLNMSKSWDFCAIMGHQNFLFYENKQKRAIQDSWQDCKGWQQRININSFHLTVIQRFTLTCKAGPLQHIDTTAYSSIFSFFPDSIFTPKDIRPSKPFRNASSNAIFEKEVQKPSNISWQMLNTLQTITKIYTN